MTSKGIALILIGALALGCVGFYYFYIKPGGEAPPTTTPPPATEAPSPTTQPTKKPKPPKSPKPTPQPTSQPTQPPSEQPPAVDFASFWRSLKPGTWAKYEMSTPQGPKMYMTVTVEGRETKRGVECIKVTYQYEMSGQAGGVATTATVWISIETGETVEVEVCIPGMGCQSGTPGQYQYTPTTATSTILGTETISVPAGTFTCYKISTPGATFWWSTDAPPLGIVKATFTTGGEMVLVALGS